jgi:hypothetical protein
LVQQDLRVTLAILVQQALLEPKVRLALQGRPETLVLRDLQAQLETQALQVLKEK